MVEMEFCNVLSDAQAAPTAWCLLLQTGRARCPSPVLPVRCKTVVDRMSHFRVFGPRERRGAAMTPSAVGSPHLTAVWTDDQLVLTGELVVWTLGKLPDTPATAHIDL